VVSRGSGYGAPWLAASLARSLVGEWGGEIEEFDVEPGGPVLVSLVLRPGGNGPKDLRGRVVAPPSSSRIGDGWALHTGTAPGRRFALCL
jgi:hypothetical protein